MQIILPSFIIFCCVPLYFLFSLSVSFVSSSSMFFFSLYPSLFFTYIAFRCHFKTVGLTEDHNMWNFVIRECKIQNMRDSRTSRITGFFPGGVNARRAVRFRVSGWRSHYFHMALPFTPSYISSSFFVNRIWQVMSASLGRCSDVMNRRSFVNCYFHSTVLRKEEPRDRLT
jgi:hypothetical protein